MDINDIANIITDDPDVFNSKIYEHFDVFMRTIFCDVILENEAVEVDRLEAEEFGRKNEQIWSSILGVPPTRAHGKLDSRGIDFVVDNIKIQVKPSVKRGFEHVAQYLAALMIHWRNVNNTNSKWSIPRLIVGSLVNSIVRPPRKVILDTLKTSGVYLVPELAKSRNGKQLVEVFTEIDVVIDHIKEKWPNDQDWFKTRDALEKKKGTKLTDKEEDAAIDNYLKSIGLYVKNFIEGTIMLNIIQLSSDITDKINDAVYIG